MNIYVKKIPSVYSLDIDYLLIFFLVIFMFSFFLRQHFLNQNYGLFFFYVIRNLMSNHNKNIDDSQLKLMCRNLIRDIEINCFLSVHDLLLIETNLQSFFHPLYFHLLMKCFYLLKTLVSQSLRCYSQQKCRHRC